MLIELRKRTYKGKLIKEVTVQKHLVAISAVLSDAKRNEIIPKNPARMVELLPVEKTVQLIPTDAEIKALMNALLDEPEHYRYFKKMQCEELGIKMSEYLFTNDKGTLIHTDTFSKRLRKIYDEIGFPKEFHLHALRCQTSKRTGQE